LGEIRQSWGGERKRDNLRFKKGKNRLPDREGQGAFVRIEQRFLVEKKKGEKKKKEKLPY